MLTGDFVKRERIVVSRRKFFVERQRIVKKRHITHMVGNTLGLTWDCDKELSGSSVDGTGSLGVIAENGGSPKIILSSKESDPSSSSSSS
uniref:Uncharacterized protein n=1 Tax=Tanacetum cinerariifolium TaxID=118510 RepID=A0A699R2A0_TANCI|nr:hypothetical protein [Tanacetum cinerariifolium]